MSDTIRWCFTCQHRPLSDGLGMEWVIDSGCVGKGHDVADALVIRAPIDYEAALKIAHSLNSKAEEYRLAHPRPSDHPIDRSMMNATVVRRVVDAALGDNE